MCKGGCGKYFMAGRDGDKQFLAGREGGKLFWACQLKIGNKEEGGGLLIIAQPVTHCVFHKAILMSIYPSNIEIPADKLYQFRLCLP